MSGPAAHGRPGLRGAGGAPRAEHNAEAEPARVAALRWAPRIDPRRLRRLYLREARGLADEAPVDDVGVALLVRTANRAPRPVTEA